MGRRGCLGECVVGIGLMILAGCSPSGHWSKGMEGQEASPAVTPAAKPSVDNKSAAIKGPEVPAREVQPNPSAQPSAPGPGGYRIAGNDPLVEARISLFAKKKEEWDQTSGRLAGLGVSVANPSSWHECLQDVDEALAGYRSLFAGQERDLKPWAIIRRDMHYYETGCDRVLAEAQAKLSGPQAGAQPPAAEGVGRIRERFESGQYEEAVALYDTLAKSEGGTPVPREAKIYCGRALVRLGRFQEAATMLTEALKETGQTTDLSVFETRMLTADVLLAAGEVDEARQVYEGLAKTLSPLVSQQEWAAAHAQAFGEQIKGEDLDRYRELIQAYLRFDGKHVPQELIDGVAKLQGEGAGPLPELAKMVLARTMAQAQTWARSQLAEVRTLIDTHELVRAKALVEQVSATAPAEMKSAISQLQEEITRAEAANQEATKTSGGQGAASPWDEALHLFEQEKYDEAIAAFQKLVDSDHGAEAKAKITEAGDLAAAAMRQQAAALYAKARKTFDPEAKRQTLLSSRTLLVKLIEKYPESSVVAKARQNLKVLDAELGQAGAAPPAVSAPADGGAADLP